MIRKVRYQDEKERGVTKINENKKKGKRERKA